MDATLPTISIAVPTLNGGAQTAHLIKHLQAQQARGCEILIIDSGSTDGTVERAEEAGLRVHRIDAADFRHGRTRNLAISMTSGEVICFLTQDVLPVTPRWPEQFAETLQDPTVAGVYGRQVPRDAATMEMYFVQLNYPNEPLRFDPREDGHHPRPGRVLFSNAFSAVRRDVIESMPYSDDTPVSEDQIWAHQALAAGHAIQYRHDVEALHAHGYTLRGLFARSHKVGQALRKAELDGGATFSESIGFLLDEIRYFAKQGHLLRLFQLLPYEFVRWLGFHVGRLK